MIRIAPEKIRFHQVLSTAGIGKHVQLVESWLMSEEYRKTFDTYVIAVDEFREERAARQARGGIR